MTDGHDFNRLLADAIQRLGAAQVRAMDQMIQGTYTGSLESLGLRPAAPAEPEITVVKHSGFQHVSDDQLMDYGVIPDTRPPVHIPWYRRLRWRWQEWRERVGRRVGGWIAGVDLTERDDW